MKLSLSLRGQRPEPTETPTSAKICLQCGMAAPSRDITFCRRCGLTFGAEPRFDAKLPSCPVCYKTVDDDGRLSSHRPGFGRVDLVAHIAEHDQFPVGDDELLESMRVGDRIRIDRWEAPFELVRRYLVTGALDSGRRRSFQHSAVVTAMAQLGRWGAEAEIFGDQQEWRDARTAVTDLMERFQRSARLTT